MVSGNELVSEKAQGGRAMAAKAGRGSEAGAGGRAFSGREQNRQGRQVGNWQGNLGSSEQRGLEVLGAPITPPGIRTAWATRGLRAQDEEVAAGSAAQRWAADSADGQPWGGVGTEVSAGGGCFGRMGKKARWAEAGEQCGGC